MFGRDKTIVVNDQSSSVNDTATTEEHSVLPAPANGEPLTQTETEVSTEPTPAQDDSFALPVTVNGFTQPPVQPAVLTPEPSSAPEISTQSGLGDNSRQYLSEAPAPEPAETLAPEALAPELSTPTDTALEMPSPETEPTDFSSASDTVATTETPQSSASDLDDLKQKALAALSPLIKHLDQSPEEKYKVAKMVCDSAPNKDNLNDVYEAAQNLTDEKAKAEAIYDIVNKINELS